MNFSAFCNKLSTQIIFYNGRLSQQQLGFLYTIINDNNYNCPRDAVSGLLLSSGVCLSVCVCLSSKRLTIYTRRQKSHLFFPSEGIENVVFFDDLDGDPLITYLPFGVQPTVQPTQNIQVARTQIGPWTDYLRRGRRRAF